MACAGGVCCPSYLEGGREEALVSEAQKEETLYRVGFESANLLKVSLVTTAAVLANLLAGFGRDDEHSGGRRLPSAERQGSLREPNNNRCWGIYTVDPDGSSLSRLIRE